MEATHGKFVSQARRLPRYDQPPPELRRTFDRWKINPNRVNRLWETLADGTTAQAAGELIDVGDVTKDKRELLGLIIADGEFVARCWAARLGGLVTYDSRRNAIMLARMIDDGYTAEELIWAGESYYAYTQSSDWHRRQRMVGQSCVKAFENFYADATLDKWIIKGREIVIAAAHRETLAKGRRQAATEDANAAAVVRRLEAAFGKLAEPERQRRINFACDLLSRGRPMLGSRDMRNLLVRNAVFGQLQKDLDKARLGNVPELDGLLSEFFGG